MINEKMADWKFQTKLSFSFCHHFQFMSRFFNRGFVPPLILAHFLTWEK